MHGPSEPLFRSKGGCLLIKAIRQVTNSRFARQVGVLAGGTAVAQVIMMLSLPVLTRIYSPQDFNLLAAYASALGLLSVAACLRFNIAIPLPEDDRTAFHLLLLSLASGGLLALVLILPVALMPATIAELLGQPTLKPFLWMLPLGVFLAAAYDALQYWASRRRRFAQVARTRVTRAVGGVGTQIGVGLVMPGSMGLLLGHMLVSGLGFLSLALSFWREDRTVARKTRPADLREAARHYRHFPLYSVPEALFNTAGLEISILIIAAMAIGPDAGFLMLAMRVLGIPMMLVGTSVAQVYLTEAPEKLRLGELVSFTRRTMWAMAKMGAPLLALAAIVSPFLFPYVFGAAWAPAGRMVLWLAPMFLFQFIASPLLVILHVTGRLPIAMWLQFGGGLFRIVSIVITGQLFPAYLVEVFAIAGAIFYLSNILVVQGLIRKLT